MSTARSASILIPKMPRLTRLYRIFTNRLALILAVGKCPSMGVVLLLIAFLAIRASSP